MVLGIDRLDYMKGLPHKLNAFDRFLQQHPEMKDSVLLLQVAVPTRTGVHEYQKLKTKVRFGLPLPLLPLPPLLLGLLLRGFLFLLNAPTAAVAAVGAEQQQ